jgi:hypothetical protein
MACKKNQSDSQFIVNPSRMASSIIKPQVTQAIGTLNATLALIVWGRALYKAKVLWKENKRKYFVMFGISLGMAAAFSLVVLNVAFLQMDPDFLTVMQHSLGSAGLFYGLYHICLMYVKLLRLRLARQLGSRFVTKILYILNVSYLLLTVAWSICFSLIAWHPTMNSFTAVSASTNSTSLVVINSIMGTVEVFMGIIVELSSVAYFRSIIAKGRQTFSIKDLGPHEYAAAGAGLWSLLATVLGTFVGIEYYFFSSVSAGAFFWFHSFICLSLISFVETVKREHSMPSKVPSSKESQGVHY